MKRRRGKKKKKKKMIDDDQLAYGESPPGGVAERLNAAVSKTVSGGFPLTRVRIPPPPFFREIWLGSRGNGRPDRLRRPSAGAPTDVHERPSWQISFPRRSPEQSRKRALPATVGLEHSRCRHSGSAGGSRGHGDRGRLSRRVIAHGLPRRPAEVKRSSRPPSRTAP